MDKPAIDTAPFPNARDCWLVSGEPSSPIPRTETEAGRVGARADKMFGSWARLEAWSLDLEHEATKRSEAPGRTKEAGREVTAMVYISALAGVETRERRLTRQAPG